MSPNQTRLYWKLWGKACHSTGWDALPSARREILRHDCHLKALGYPRSSKQLTNPEFDRIKYWFRLIIDPDDLEATRFFMDPSIGPRRRLEVAIAKFPDALVRKLSIDRFGSPAWRDLQVDQQLQLLMMLQRVRKRHEESIPAAGEPP